jgi:integrase
MHGRAGHALQGEPGTPEFIASYNEAAAQKIKPPTGLLLSLLQAYQASEDFRQLARRTQDDYKRIIQKEIEPEYSDFPLSGLTDRRTRGVFMDWRDRLALKSRRQADYAWTVLARVLSWSKDRGKITVNPCERGGRIYSGSRAENIWSDEQEAAFLQSAPPHLHLPLLLALWTGQRQGDLLRLPWSAYNGKEIRLRHSKTGARVVIPIGAPLKAALDTTTKRSTLILVNSDGTPWTQDGFRASWRKACAKVGVSGGDVQRLARHGGDAVSTGRMHRGRNCNDHRTQLARRSINSRRTLFAPRSCAGRKCNQEARKENRNVQMTSQMVYRVQLGKGGKSNEINWLGN